jgi:hypothetical protein
MQPPSVVRKLQKEQIPSERVERLFEKKQIAPGQMQWPPPERHQQKEQVAPGQMQWPPPERHQQKEQVAPGTEKLQSHPSERQQPIPEKFDLVIEKKQRASATIDHSFEKEKSDRPPSHPNPHLTPPISLPITPRGAIPLAKATVPQDNQDNQSRGACQRRPINRLIERHTEGTVDRMVHVRRAINQNPASQFENSHAYADFLVYDPDIGVYKPTMPADVAFKSATNNTHRYDEEGFHEAFADIEILQSVGTCMDALCPPRDPYNPPHNHAPGGTPMLRKKRFTDRSLKKQRSQHCVSSDQQTKAIGCLESDVPVVSWPSVRVVVLILDTIYNLVSLQFDFLNAFRQSELGENERVNVEKIKGYNFSPSAPPDDAVFRRRKPLYGPVQSPKAVYRKGGETARRQRAAPVSYHPPTCRK